MKMIWQTQVKRADSGNQQDYHLDVKILLQLLYSAGMSEVALLKAKNLSHSLGGQGPA